MPSEISAQVMLEEKVRFAGQVRDLPTVVMDYTPPLGDGAGMTGLETLLLSLAGCSGTSVISLLRKMKQPVTGLQVQAHGTRRDEHPTVLTQIELTFIVSGTGVDSAAVQRAIALSEEQLCPVWAMLKPCTPITSSFQIVQAVPVA